MIVTNLTWLGTFAPTLLAEGPAPAKDMLTQFLPMMIIMFGIIYFVLLRPQNKERKAHEEMLANLAKNDHVVTQGGILGRVAAIEKESGVVTLQIADNTRIKIMRRSISNKIDDEKDKGND